MDERPGEGAMKLHGNAKLTPKGRLALVQVVEQKRTTLNAAAAAFKVSTLTARKWVQRSASEGAAGLQYRSSRPARLRAATPPKVIRRIEQWRRSRMTEARIAELTGVSTMTVARTLKRLGLSRLSALDPEAPARRHEHACAGDLLHPDTKTLGRILQIGHRATGDRRDRLRGHPFRIAECDIREHDRCCRQARLHVEMADADSSTGHTTCVALHRTTQRVPVEGTDKVREREDHRGDQPWPSRTAVVLRASGCARARPSRGANGTMHRRMMART
jgi:transposase